MSEIQDEEKREVEERQPEVEGDDVEQAAKKIEEQHQQQQENGQNEQHQEEQGQQVQAEAEQEESPAQREQTDEKEQVQSENEQAQNENEEQQNQEPNEQVDTVNEAEAEQIQHKPSYDQIDEDILQVIRVQPQVMPKKQIKKTYKPKKVQKTIHRQNLDFEQLLKQILRENKLLKVIFAHFCKENNLMYMKSSLFEDRQKKMEEMSLNKWMVFCKQFQIYSKLCKIKNSARQARFAEQQLPLQTSQVKQLHRMKEAKQVQKTLITIFKHSNENASKIPFQSFVTAVSNIFDEFKQYYPREEKGINQFLSEVLHCSNEKTCYRKLSHLKFTTNTPQIEYNKLTFPERQIRSKVKTKAAQGKTKQNQESRMHTFSSKEKKQTLTRNFTKLNLNPVLVQAKRSLNEFNTYSKRGMKNHLSLAKLTVKLQKPKQKEQQMQLITYFKSTKDPILDSYFMLQSGKKMTEILP